MIRGVKPIELPMFRYLRPSRRSPSSYCRVTGGPTKRSKLLKRVAGEHSGGKHGCDNSPVASRVAPFDPSEPRRVAED